MASKTVEDVDLKVDKLSLSLVGWNVDEARARLVTTPLGSGVYRQHIAVSATLRFIPDDWTDRFQESDEDSFAPTVYISLNRNDAPAPSASHVWVVLEDIKKAAKGVTRISLSSDDWTCSSPWQVQSFDLRMKAFDLADVSNVYMNSKLRVPRLTDGTLPVAVVDFSDDDGVRTVFTTATAHLSSTGSDELLAIHAEGTFEFASDKDLLRSHFEEFEWRKFLQDIPSYGPILWDTPEFEFEILDESGFLLEKRHCNLYGHISVDKSSNSSRRHARWMIRKEVLSGDLAGVPAEVVIRIGDANV